MLVHDVSGVHFRDGGCYAPSVTCARLGAFVQPMVNVASSFTTIEGSVLEPNMGHGPVRGYTDTPTLAWRSPH